MVGDRISLRWRLAVDILAFLTAVSLLISGWALYGRFTQSNQNRAANQKVWRGVICNIERQVIANSLSGVRPMSTERLRGTLAFYDKLLVEDVDTEPCGLVEEVG